MPPTKISLTPSGKIRLRVVPVDGADRYDVQYRTATGNRKWVHLRTITAERKLDLGNLLELKGAEVRVRAVGPGRAHSDWSPPQKVEAA